MIEAPDESGVGGTFVLIHLPESFKDDVRFLRELVHRLDAASGVRDIPQGHRLYPLLEAVMMSGQGLRLQAYLDELKEQSG
jgi:hypothetical protein